MDKELEELFGKKDGPKQITPPTPKPYWSCADCNFYQESMACSGGLRGAPTYHKSCHHVDAWPEGSTLCGTGRRSLNTKFHGGDTRHKTVTPSWCPFLRKEEENNVLSDSTD